MTISRSDLLTFLTDLIRKGEAHQTIPTGLRYILLSFGAGDVQIVPVADGLVVHVEVRK